MNPAITEKIVLIRKHRGSHCSLGPQEGSEVGGLAFTECAFEYDWFHSSAEMSLNDLGVGCSAKMVSDNSGSPQHPALRDSLTRSASVLMLVKCGCLLGML